MSIPHKTAVSGNVGAEPQSIWPLILAVLAMGMLVVTSQLTIKADYSVMMEAPERVVREFPARPNLLDLDREAYLARLLKQERALVAEAGRYSSLGLFFEAGRQQPDGLVQVQ